MLRPHLANSLRLPLMGAWLMGTVSLWVIATENFRRVDAVLSSPHSEFHQRLEPLPAGEARVVLRFLASELNRVFPWLLSRSATFTDAFGPCSTW